jgi:uncharacterized membrane protein YvbJ
MTEEIKKCPFCGEDILKVAIKCKHCGSMLDGSDQNNRVTVSGVDPFAELHTPIKGKAKGKVTFIGKLGIGIGILMIIGGFVMMGSASSGEEVYYLILTGFGFMIASFLWARNPIKK